MLLVLQLIVYLNAVELVEARGKPIDIFNNDKNDILQLRGTDKIRTGDVGNKLHSVIFSNSKRKWNLKDINGNTVLPYRITGNFDYYEHSIIKQAMKRIESKTCIRFRERTTERDFIDIQNRRGEGCYTSVGRLFGKNVLMLESNSVSTCLETHIVQHELLHAIGLWHEHMRYDRDQYIKVHYENIKPGYESQFQKVSPLESTVYNIPYDYRSLMHYGKMAFAIPGTITMEALDRKYTNVIGKQRDASSSDYLKVCKAYNCKTCNDEIVNPDEEDDKEPIDPWLPTTTLKPPPVKGCVDMIYGLCSFLIGSGIMSCNSGGTKFCCATCKGGKDGIDLLGFYDDFFDNF
ncbi:astacin [Dictyocaulus viviparus]|uniref:Metalloendopeptidase n=1 Tax=Dictyocaulus viviparus TaxID=29172 RepID=A0A0D8YCU9_DICVI|nr:astacin [Dictyocaulus viviparus]